MPLRKAAAERLRAAMARLLAGTSLHTDGRLTWTNVYVEAGVPKATANRAADIKGEWKQALDRIPDAPSPPPDKDSEPTQAQVISALRETIAVMASHIQALFLDNEQLNKSLGDRNTEVVELRLELARLSGPRNIIPIRSP